MAFDLTQIEPHLKRETGETSGPYITAEDLIDAFGAVVTQGNLKFDALDTEIRDMKIVDAAKVDKAAYTAIGDLLVGTGQGTYKTLPKGLVAGDALVVDANLELGWSNALSKATQDIVTLDTRMDSAEQGISGIQTTFGGRLNAVEAKAASNEGAIIPLQSKSSSEETRLNNVVSFLGVSFPLTPGFTTVVQSLNNISQQASAAASAAQTANSTASGFKNQIDALELWKTTWEPKVDASLLDLERDITKVNEFLETDDGTGNGKGFFENYTDTHDQLQVLETNYNALTAALPNTYASFNDMTQAKADITAVQTTVATHTTEIADKVADADFQNLKTTVTGVQTSATTANTTINTALAALRAVPAGATLADVINVLRSL